MYAAHFYIGMKVESFDSAVAFFEKLGLENLVVDTEYRNAAGRTVVDGHLVTIEYGEDQTDLQGFIGFPLTSRYRPSILDQGYERGYERGAPPLFEVDMIYIQTLLVEVQTWWPAARVFLWDREI